jgi:hypothetical protein
MEIQSRYQPYEFDLHAPVRRQVLEGCQPASNFDQQPAPKIDQGLWGYFRFLNR